MSVWKFILYFLKAISKKTVNEQLVTDKGSYQLFISEFTGVNIKQFLLTIIGSIYEKYQYRKKRI